MDQRTLVVSCVEYYSDLKNIPSNKVFISFQQSGFIDLILDSHKTFPEMDIDFFVGMIDGLTYLESDAGEQEKEYTHHENRAAVGAEVVALLQKKHKMRHVKCIIIPRPQDLSARIRQAGIRRLHRKSSNRLKQNKK